jgi:hypothetical protein
MATHHIITKDNPKEGKGNGFDLPDGDTLFVEQGGWIKSTNDNIGSRALISNFFANDITVSGLIDSKAGTGIHLLNGGSITVSETGVVSGGRFGISLSRSAADMKINNIGKITGIEDSIFIAGAGGNGRFTLINEGILSGRVSAQALTNIITNNGLIVGDVRFAEGADIYDGSNGTVTGLVDLFLGNDIAQGGVGSETFKGGRGDDTIRGGGGSDTAVFSGARVNYTISRNLDGSITVVDANPNGEGADKLTDIRFAKFADTTEVFFNKAPTALGISATSFSEAIQVGGVIATLSARDADGDAIKWTLSDPSGAFTLDGNTLRLGKPVDYESGIHAFSITLTASDAYGGSTSQSFILNLINAIETTGLVLTGTPGVDTLIGEAGDDAIAGLGGNDVLKGEAGNDRLSGGLGNDQLWGGDGRDVFVFETRLNKRTNVDKIVDFSAADDSMYLENAIFTKLGSGSATRPKKITSDMFVKGTKAKDAEDRIIYDKKTGALYYDQDGTGSKAQVKIAVLTNKAALSHNDFFVI